MRNLWLLTAVSVAALAVAWLATRSTSAPKEEVAFAQRRPAPDVESVERPVSVAAPAFDAFLDPNGEEIAVVEPTGFATEERPAVDTAERSRAPSDALSIEPPASMCSGAAQIYGCVFDDQNVLVENAALRAEHGDVVHPCVHEARTGWDGRYLMTGLPAGPLRVVERHGVDFAEERTQYVVLEATSDVRLDFGLPPPPRRWRGRVTTRGGDELPAQFQIELRNVETRRRSAAQTANDGSFEIELEAGQYEVAIASPMSLTYPGVDLRRGNLRHDLVLPGAVVLLRVETDVGVLSPEEFTRSSTVELSGESTNWGPRFHPPATGSRLVAFCVRYGRYYIKLSSMRYRFANGKDADSCVDVSGDTTSLTLKLKRR